jgi:hypothetical protein
MNIGNESGDKRKTQPTVSERWECRHYGSGTCTVEDANGPKRAFAHGVHGLSPHLYVYGPGNADEAKYIRDRIKCCEDIRDYLNGGERPAWLDDMQRVSETHATDMDGTSITATGPSYDANPPSCHWRQDESPEARDARSRLMDRLFLSR